MKTFKYIMQSLFIGAAISCSLVGCNKEDKIDKEHSIFDVQTPPATSFDKWLHRNYVETYNIDFKYRMDDKDVEYKYHLAPADLKKSMQLASIIKHAWLEAYTEVAGINFIRKHAPAILPIIGSAAWNGDGTMTLGTAEGGLKITLYMANWLDPKDVNKMNEYFFKTMHHEFTHILQQDVYYPNKEFDVISAPNYNPSGWFNRKSPEYEKLGFVTAYAGHSPVEDITEVTACYITMSDEEWKRIFDNAGPEGKAILDHKVKIMKDYMKDVWNIDMDVLRTVVHRRMEEVANLTLLQPEWLPLIDENHEESTETSADASFRLMKANVKSNMSTLINMMQSSDEANKAFRAVPGACCHAHLADLMDIVNK